MQNRKADVLIAGAGASGMMAAKVLSENGLKVIVLEARDRIGGRIHTYIDQHFPGSVELGAEFIHGELPLTIKILQEAGIAYAPSGGRPFHVKDGKIVADDFFIPQWELLEKKLQELDKDMTIAGFLEEHFKGEEFVELRSAVTGFAEGYDAADTNLASSFALRNEWLDENQESNYRVINGYGKLIEYLYKKCVSNHANVVLSAAVHEIQWKKELVTALTGAGNFTAKKILLAVPLGILQQQTIAFAPAIPEKISAAKNIGYGDVIKILLYFKDKFWKEYGLDAMGFLFTERSVPTWWTQYPENSSLLTGWIAGPDARSMMTMSDSTLLQEAVSSLAETFQLSSARLEEFIVAKKVVNWSADPFCRGAYAYATLETESARKILSSPVEDTVYFAGEALYAGHAIGTVEAALVSGKEVAESMLRH